MMLRALRTAILLALPAILSGCFLAPGAFISTLDLRRDGSFAFAYKGEVVFASPDEMMQLGEGRAEEVWSDDRATCEDATDTVTPAPARFTPVAADDEIVRSCTSAQIAEQRKVWEAERDAKAEKRAKDAKQFGAVFGFTPGDDDANRKLAATYAKYQGYRSVTYRGNGVFDVDYAAAGKLSHEFIFPVLPQQDIIFPFVAVRRQADGSARINAPSLIGGGLRGLAAKLSTFGSAMEGKELPASSRAKGTFTITTDGEVLTNNTEEGASNAAGQRTLRWEIGPDTQKVPEALIRLKP